MTPLDEPTYPFPPRYWWLKRIVAASILLTTAFAGTMWWWNREANRRMQAEVDAIHARGEPILLEDLARDPLPDARNAAFYLKSAAAAIALNTSEAALIDNLQVGAELSAADHALLKSAYQKTATTRSLARQARFVAGVDWGTTVRSPVIGVLLPHLSGQRQLARTLAAAAWHEHLEHNDAEAIEICDDILRQSDALQESPAWLMTHLVGVGISSLAANQIRALSYDLDVRAASDAATQPTGPSSRKQVQRLIARLLDESAYRRGWTNAMHGERISQRDMVTTNAAVPFMPISTSGPWALLRPAFVLDGIRMMRATSDVASAVQQSTYKQAQAKCDPSQLIRRPEPPFSLAAHIMSSVMYPSTSGALRTHYRGLIERRIAALRLAIRLYQIDHGGEYPINLSDLCPDYIAAIPADPFATHSRPIAYVRSPEPFLYSVGDDGTDNGGSAATKRPPPQSPINPPAGHPDDKRFWDRADLIFPLKKPTWKPPPPTTEDSPP